MEKWKDIAGYEGRYMVSNAGRVRSLDRIHKKPNGNKIILKGKILTQTMDAHGYMVVGLTAYRKCKIKKVHRLVAAAFIPNTKNQSIINHKNEIRHDNHFKNLEWCDGQYNTEYSLAKIYSFYSPKGHRTIIKNLSRFCRENNLLQGSMHILHSGKMKCHRGWKNTSDKSNSAFYK